MRLRENETNPRVIYRANRQPRPYDKPWCQQSAKDRGMRAEHHGHTTPAAQAWQSAKWQAKGNRLRALLESKGWRFEWVGDSDFDWDGWCDRGWQKWDDEHRCLTCLALPDNFEPGMRKRDARYSCDHYAEGCVLKDRKGRVRASIWGIVDADTYYRAYTEAELAYEALADIRKAREDRRACDRAMAL